MKLPKESFVRFTENYYKIFLEAVDFGTMRKYDNTLKGKLTKNNKFLNKFQWMKVFTCLANQRIHQTLRALVKKV